MICDKLPYKDHKEAQDHLQSVRKKCRKGQLFRTYKCTQCGMYHVTTVHKSTLHKEKDPKYPLVIPPKHEIKLPKMKKPKEINRLYVQVKASVKIFTPEQANILKQIIRNKTA
jgi:hypothetical protein